MVRLLLLFVLIAPIAGCGGGIKEKTPEESEKARQEHIQATQREMQESGGGR